ncbi:MAG: tetratricopeptide (TPR) repeat protein [Paraglaciecola sp.]|jgi:tetratricopeptide (TPR) repeat protein
MIPMSIETLIRLFQQSPANKHYLEQLVGFHQQNKDWASVCQCYKTYLALIRDDADNFFNYGYHLRLLGEYQQAINQYNMALSLNISQPEEVHVNIALIYAEYLRQDAKAFDELEKALALNAQYMPALYNLANLYEDRGEKEQAYQMFEKILSLQPRYYDALARMAQINKFNTVNDPLIQQLIIALQDANIDSGTKANVYFALGKAFDDCQDYKQAFMYVEQGNKLDKTVSSSYNEKAQQRYIDTIKAVFSDERLVKIDAISDTSPVFICGMFRSGSTLVEQILAAHPKVTAGGEREFFIRLISGSLSPFPSSMLLTSFAKLQAIADEYLADLRKAFPGSTLITDKRPENFLYIGLLKVLFPNARFIHTLRNPLDNCLSIFFLRLGNKMNYALSLRDTAHYYQLQDSLMLFWKQKYPQSIHTVSYDNLVNAPESEVRQLLSFLSLEWDDNCLDFYKVKNTVKTASVWQVRQALYKSSSGRWHNYKDQIPSLIETFKNNGKITL